MLRLEGPGSRGPTSGCCCSVSEKRQEEEEEERVYNYAEIVVRFSLARVHNARQGPEN